MKRLKVWFSSYPAESIVVGLAPALGFLIVVGVILTTSKVAIVEHGVFEALGETPSATPAVATVESKAIEPITVVPTATASDEQTHQVRKLPDATSAVVTVESKTLKPIGVKRSVSSSVRNVVTEANGLREAGFRASVSKIDSGLKQIVQNARVSKFAEEMVGMQSKFTLLSGDTAYREWARSRFTKMVFDPADVRQIIVLQLAEFHKSQSEIDDRVFVELNIDVDFDGSEIGLPHFDLRSLDNQTNVIVSQVQDTAWQSVGELAVSSGIGFAAGGAASKMISDSGEKDAYGNPTIENQIASFLGDLIVGLAAEHVVSTLVDTQGRLESNLRTAINDNFSSLYSGATGAKCWKAPLRQVLEHHDAACKRIITEKTGYTF